MDNAIEPKMSKPRNDKWIEFHNAIESLSDTIVELSKLVDRIYSEERSPGGDDPFGVGGINTFAEFMSSGPDRMANLRKFLNESIDKIRNIIF